MPTSEELRTLVAEKVMGWEEDAVYNSEPIWWDGHTGFPCSEWNPLESWADAGRVIAKIRADWTYKKQRLFSLLLKQIVLMKLVEDDKKVDHNWVVFVDPVDICAAVLEAQGVEVE